MLKVLEIWVYSDRVAIQGLGVALLKGSFRFRASTAVL